MCECSWFIYLQRRIRARWPENIMLNLFVSALETILGSGVYLSGCCKHGSVDSRDCSYLWCRFSWMYKVSSSLPPRFYNLFPLWMQSSPDCNFICFLCCHLETRAMARLVHVSNLHSVKSLNMNTCVVTHWGPSRCCMPTLSAIFGSDSRFTPSNCPVSGFGSSLS